MTRLIADEKGWKLDEKGFEVALAAQKERGRQDAKRSTSGLGSCCERDVEFVGYDLLEVTDANLLRYRKVQDKKGEYISVSA